MQRAPSSDTCSETQVKVRAASIIRKRDDVVSALEVELHVTASSHDDRQVPSVLQVIGNSVAYAQSVAPRNTR